MLKLGISVTAGSCHYPLHGLGVMETVVHVFPLSKGTQKILLTTVTKKKSYLWITFEEAMLYKS